MMTKTTLSSIGGLVLCGGDSRRMGQSKAWLDLHGRSMLDCVVGTVSGVSREVVVASRADQSLPPLSWPVSYVYDDPKHAGPLAGIAAGMKKLGPTCEVVVVVACDHPLVQAHFLSMLIEALGDGLAVVPTCEGKAYPLLAVYRVRTLAMLSAQLDRNNLRAMDFVRGCKAKMLDVKEMALTEKDNLSLKNVNAPKDWQDLQKYADIH